MAISTNPKPTIYRILYENTDPERYFSSVIYKDKYQEIVDISTPIRGIAENPCFWGVACDSAVGQITYTHRRMAAVEPAIKTTLIVTLKKLGAVIIWEETQEIWRRRGVAAHWVTVFVR